MELPKIFSDVIEQVLPLVQAECLSIILREHNHLTYVAADRLEAGQLLGQQIPLEEGVPGEVMRTGNVVQVAEEDGRFNITNVCPCHLQLPHQKTTFRHDPAGQISPLKLAARY